MIHFPHDCFLIVDNAVVVVNKGLRLTGGASDSGPLLDDDDNEGSSKVKAVAMLSAPSNDEGKRDTMCCNDYDIHSAIP